MWYTSCCKEVLNLLAWVPCFRYHRLSILLDQMQTGDGETIKSGAMRYQTLFSSGAGIALETRPFEPLVWICHSRGLHSRLGCARCLKGPFRGGMKSRIPI